MKKKLYQIPLLKTATPVTSSTRHYKYILKNTLIKKNNLLKSLTFNFQRSFGRSSKTGHITVRGKHSGCKKLYRKLYFFNNLSLGIVLFSLYDPNRTAFISAVFDFLNYKFHFIPAVHNQSPGSIIGCKEPNYKYFKGFRYQLQHHLNGSIISYLNSNSNKNAKYSRAAGTYCQLLLKSKLLCKIRLPSNQIINISPLCFATLGAVSNIYHRFISIGKAGRNRLKGSSPKVRGIAMNPVDHPHGGRTNGGCCWVTPWGKPFRFRKTSRSLIKKIYKLL
jgi:large subunit ribosomal protein L2